MDDPRPAGSRTLATVKTVGWIAGALLAGALIAIVVVDRKVHLADTGSDSLVPWWMFVAWSLLFYALYWVGFRYLVQTLRRHDAASQRLIRDLTEANENLELAQTLGRTGTWTAIRDGPITWTGSAAQLIGLEPSKTRITPEAFIALIHPDDRKRALSAYLHALRTRGTLALDLRMQPPDGGLRWVSIRGAVAEDRSRIAGTIVDVTRQMHAHERLVATEHQFRILFDDNPMAFCVYDATTLEILEINKAVVQQFGYSREELIGVPISAMAIPEQRSAVAEEVEAYAGKPQMAPRIWSAQRKDGSIRELRIHATAIRFHGRDAWLILAEDVTEQLARQRELAYRATYDPVTGLLNGRAVADALQAQEDQPWRLAYIQLRGLELIEDSLGQAVGTRVMQRMARRLERLGYEYGEVGHLRPEEFVLAVRDPARWDQALRELREELSRSVSGAGSRQQLEAWIGTARFPDDHPDAMEAIHLAGLAAHLGRAEGHAMVAFEPSMSHKAGHRLRMAARMHRALDNCEFQLHFQQIRDLRNGRTTGLEALVRWPQPEGGFIPPADFIGVAEDTGLIVPLGRWVLQEAVRAYQSLVAAGHEGLSIAINVSQVQFLKTDLLRDFDEVFRAHALPRGALHVELTESILMTRPEQARALLAQLQERGVCISLDDFGTGFSSMAYLHHLPIDAMKIDRAFVRHVHVDRRNASICQALLQLGHGLSLTVVAEGVEEQAEYDWLRDHQCDKAQGYCIARPAPLEKILDSLEP